MLEKKNLGVLIFNILFVLCCFTVTYIAGEESSLVKILYLKGDVQLLRVKAEKWETVKKNSIFYKGDCIKTGSASKIIIEFLDRTQSVIGPLSEVILREITDGTQGSKTIIDMKIGKNWIRCDIKKDYEKEFKSEFLIKTPIALAHSRGTMYSADVDENSTSKFDVYQGAIEVSSTANPDKKMYLQENNRAVFSPDRISPIIEEIPSEELNRGKSVFSQMETMGGQYSLKIKAEPENISPGETANLTIRILKDGKPFRTKLSYNVKLKGSAKFADYDSSEVVVESDEDGIAVLKVVGTVEEKISVDVSVSITLPK